MTDTINFVHDVDTTDKPLPNVIFLDMDGVLCTPRACQASGDSGGGYDYLDPIACLLVRRLCEEANAKLVISSAWRITNSYLSMTSILGAACPRLGRYIWPTYGEDHWRTPNHIYADDTNLYTTSDRGREIQKWLDDHAGQFNRFVILDDMMDMRPLDHHHVLCNLDDGMSLRNFYDALGMLRPGGD